ncbi:cold-shock protein [Myroides sp. WP-1]|uniref:cold-shock protein n=1 Tax=Myroides sp. WP-1 TaxID=2759944 RepID=UPI0015F98081|nr:cold shock domain-containing protein [Myroides sp. WP-1]MBB1140522.1 cold shock domain-containing protein [Myroides sp. WP-1]
MADSFFKKENNKKKKQKQEEKLKRREERKQHNNKGKDLEDLFVYVDKQGQLTHLTPEEQALQEKQDYKNTEKISQENHEGTISYVTDKGYAFVIDSKTRESIFLHQNDLNIPLEKGLKISFKLEQSKNGIRAVEAAKTE